MGIDDAFRRIFRPPPPPPPPPKPKLKTKLKPEKKAHPKTVRSGFERTDPAKRAITRSAPKAAEKTAIAAAGSWLRHASRDLGVKMQQGGRLIERGADMLHGVVPQAPALKLLGREAQMAGRALVAAPKAFDIAVGTAIRVGAEGHRLMHEVERNVVKTGQHVAKDVQQGLATCKKGFDVVSAAVGKAADWVVEKSGAGKMIDSLGVGDSATLKLGGDVTVNGVNGSLEETANVTRTEDGYKVTVGGKVGLGVEAVLGQGEKGAKGNVSAGLGGQVEMTFKTAEEAKRAAAILLRANAAAAASGGATAIAAPVIAPTPEEMKFLADHTTAIEVDAGVAAEISGKLGVANLAAGASVEQGLRIEFPKNGPPEVVVKQSVEVEGSGSIKGSEGSMKMKVEQEVRFTLPANVDLDALRNDPAKTIGRYAKEMAKSAVGTYTISGDVSGKSGEKGRTLGASGEISFSGNISEIVQSGAIGHFVRGDMEKGLAALGPKVTISGKVSAHETDAFGFSKDFKAAEWGIGLSMGGSHKDVNEASVHEFSGTGTEVWNRFLQGLEQGITISGGSEGEASNVA